MQCRMEHNRSNVSFTIASLQLLDAVTSISAKQFDNVTSATGRCEQCSVWVDSKGSNFSIVSWNEKVNTLVHDYQNNKMSEFKLNELTYHSSIPLGHLSPSEVDRLF